jgi:hypothetical protein
MLYQIILIIIFAVLAIAVFVLFRRFAAVQKRRKEWQLRETEFMNKLVAEGYLKPGQLSELHDFDKNQTI